MSTQAKLARQPSSDAEGEPAWMRIAWREMGTAERPGTADNAKIIGYFRDVGHGWVRRDETAWCAAFLGACLERAGVESTRSLKARSYLGWGERLARPRPGCITVLSRGRDKTLGHVAFFVREEGPDLFLLGGNQKDSVSVARYPKWRVLGYRWPSSMGDDPEAGRARAAGKPDGEGAGGADRLFETALAHVLAMEGGWSNDPVDPGGPTNKGITLRVYAAHKGLRITSANRARLMDELRRIPMSTVRAIYYKRYWLRARCDMLPDPLALMHFDTAVNHGPARAARILQEALGVAIDGEIGPETLGAVRAAQGEMEALLARYAAIRRRTYRRLPHFWRFGRGWLARVRKTLAAARRLFRAPRARGREGGEPAPSAQDGTARGALKNEVEDVKGESMQTRKWWLESLTIWGAIITAASTVLPVIAPLFGFDITAEMVQTFGEQVARLIQAAGGVVGTLMTVYGRLRARTGLERRAIRVAL